MKRVLVFIILFHSISISISLAQEELIQTLRNNPHPAFKTEANSLRSADYDTFDLEKNAFWDDFSQQSIYPKKELWLDNFVFINSSMAYRPMSYNVATFDGLNALGIPYNPGVINSKGSIADRLTSVPIDLSKYTEGDSIYLSFFYQPQGLGDAPEPFDSFVLEFKPSRYWNGYLWDSNAYVRVWSAEGSTLKDFRQVIIKVPQFIFDTSQGADTIAYFYHEAFQFRFMNYGNLSGNMDHWHLDYVYLNKGRSYDDLYYRDMTITKKPLSLLKDYRSMPWKHFDKDKNMLRNTFKIHARNMSDQPLNLIGKCVVVDTLSKVQILFARDDKTIYHADTVLTLAFNLRDSLQLANISNADTVVLYTELRSDIIDDYKENDISYVYQEFINHYAYDDGIPEMGYSIYPGNFAQVAYRFRAGKVPAQDSLRGVHLYFNLSDDNVSFMAFKILIWNKGDYTTEPVVIETRVPELDPELGNGFYYYPFDTILSVKGDFYIGWEQNAEFKINIGLDMNYYELLEDTFPVRPNPNIFWKTFGDWKASAAKGALMMRPVFSDKAVVTVNVEENIIEENKPFVYPNPAKDHISISGIEVGEFTIYNTQGQIVLSGNYKAGEKINVVALDKTLYLIRIYDAKNKKFYNNKLIVK